MTKHQALIVAAFVGSIVVPASLLGFSALSAPSATPAIVAGVTTDKTNCELQPPGKEWSAVVVDESSKKYLDLVEAISAGTQEWVLVERGRICTRMINGEPVIVKTEPVRFARATGLSEAWGKKR